MRVIVDTNIVFSAIISDKGKIGELLLNKPGGVEFLSPVFLLEELSNHAEKILSITRYSKAEYQQIKSLVFKHVEFVGPDKINKVSWERAYNLLEDVDENDIAFLALNIEMNGFLWAGDKKLIKGLQNKDYDHIITTDMLYTKYFQL